MATPHHLTTDLTVGFLSALARMLSESDPESRISVTITGQLRIEPFPNPRIIDTSAGSRFGICSYLCARIFEACTKVLTSMRRFEESKGKFCSITKILS